MRHNLFLGIVTAWALACCVAQANATTYALVATFVDDGSSQAKVGQSGFTVNSLTIAPNDAPSSLSATPEKMALASPDSDPQFTGWYVNLSRESWQNTQHTWLSARKPLPYLPDVPTGDTVGGVQTADLQRLFALIPPSGAMAGQDAAFQAAVRQVVDEIGQANGDCGLGSSFDASQITQASLQETHSMYGMYSIDTQNFSFFVPALDRSNDAPVPEPLTFVTGFLAISGLGYYARRMTRAAAKRP